MSSYDKSEEDDYHPPTERIDSGPMDLVNKRKASTKQSLHALQLKNAITRQELSIVNRDTIDLKAQILLMKTQRQELKRILTNDEKLLSQQEKTITSAMLVSALERLNCESSGCYSKTIENKQSWISQMRAANEEELVLYRTSFDCIKEVKEELGNAEALVPLMKSIEGVHERHIHTKDAYITMDESFINEDIAYLHSAKDSLKKLYEEFHETLKKEQNRIFQMDDAISRLHGKSNTQIKDTPPPGEHALSVAKNFVTRLKSKAFEHSPALQAESKRKHKRTLYFNFS